MFKNNGSKKYDLDYLKSAFQTEKNCLQEDDAKEENKNNLNDNINFDNINNNNININNTNEKIDRKLASRKLRVKKRKELTKMNSLSDFRMNSRSNTNKST